MTPSDFWKNFRLGEELHIAGAFIYNGLRQFHELEKLDYSDELFEFLYNLSVGLERILKTAVVMYEHNETTDQAQLENSLITHNHLDLVARLRNHVDLKLGINHNDFLSLLTKFYKSLRYDRFMLISAYQGEKEATAIREFLAKHLKADFSGRDSLFGNLNEGAYRKFIRKTVLKISQQIYRSIENQARKINLYTYELRNGSKAESVFLREVDIGDEDILWKELLVFFMNTDTGSGYFKFLKEIQPLGFDPALIPDYLDCFRSNASKASVMDELEHHYEELDRDERRDRLQLMGCIGSPNVYFDSDDDDDDDDDDDESYTEIDRS